jgi:hypothetical protein
MAEQVVRILPDSTGKRVRVVEVTRNALQVEQQVVCIANERGDILPTSELMSEFGLMRVAAPITLFDGKFLSDKQPLFWDETLVGGGTVTYDAAHSHVELAVTGGVDSAVMQTHMRFNYQAGKSQLIMMSGLFSQQANVRKRVGYFDGITGLFLEVTGTGISMNIMNAAAVTETAAQAAWNLDPLDGTGPSGVTLDLDATQILIIDFQWLGTGRVRFGFIIGGRIVYVHAFDHANVAGNAFAYMLSPNLPLRYDVLSSGGAGSAIQICSTVVVEGGSTDRGLTYSVDMGVTPLTLPASGVQALIAVRLKAGRAATVVPDGMNLLTTTVNANIRWEMRMNPVVAGTALVWVGVDDTSIEVAYGVATNLVTGGFQGSSGYLSSQVRLAETKLNPSLLLGTAFFGTQDVLILSAQAVAGTPNVLAELSFREIL